MFIFDKIDPMDLDSRERHLWMLALMVILVMAIGLALMMYPAIFSHPLVLAGPSVRTFFFGFCVLSLLLISYLTDRYIVIRKLRRQLAEEEQLIAHIRREASSDLLKTLPGFDHFRDRLAMEHRRSSHMDLPFSLLIIRLKPSDDIRETQEGSTAFGDAAKAISRKLRPEDSLYYFAPGLFGLILPGVATPNANTFLGRLADGLVDASGASVRFSSEFRVLNYPEHTATAREMEDSVRAYLPSQDRVEERPQGFPQIAQPVPGGQL